MRKKKVEAIGQKSFKSQVINLVKKHKKVEVIFAGDGDLRKRLIKEDGTCDVAYRYFGRHRWSRYDESCFMSYINNQTSGGYNDWRTDRWIPERVTKKGKKKTLKNTVEALIKHDKSNEIVPLEIRYGKGMKKKLYILGAW